MANKQEMDTAVTIGFLSGMVVVGCVGGLCAYLNKLLHRVDQREKEVFLSVQARVDELCAKERENNNKFKEQVNTNLDKHYTDMKNIINKVNTQLASALTVAMGTNQDKNGSYKTLGNIMGENFSVAKDRLYSSSELVCDAYKKFLDDITDRGNDRKTGNVPYTEPTQPAREDLLDEIPHNTEPDQPVIQEPAHVLTQLLDTEYHPELPYLPTAPIRRGYVRNTGFIDELDEKDMISAVRLNRDLTDEFLNETGDLRPLQ